MKPKLLVLTSTFPRWEGDTEPSFVFDLCRHLAADWAVTVLAPHAPGTKCRDTMAGVAVVRFRYGPPSWETLAYQGGIMANLRRNRLLLLMVPLFLVALVLALGRLVRQLRPDAVHAHWLVPQGVALALMPRGRAIRACTVHGSDVSALRGALWTWLRRRVTERCDHVVAVSQALRDRLAAEGCAEARLSVISMGIDADASCPPEPPSVDSQELLFVGRLVAGKGVEVLIRALPGILARHPATTLAVVGDGPERPGLEQLARQEGVAGRVRFVGALPHGDLADHYRRAALLVLPSREEGFGLVVAEAMGHCCPVVASDLPAVRALVRDGETGRLVPPGDAQALAEGVAGLLADRPLRRRMAEAGRAWVADRHGWPAIARRYGAILAGEGRGAP